MATWQYLACPGGVLNFADNQLTVNTRRYLRDDDYQRISELAGRAIGRRKKLN